MPAVTKPFTLKPVEAQAANASAPALVAGTVAQAPSGGVIRCRGCLRGPADVGAVGPLRG